jgi:phosphoglycerol transferase MdoB-like AlkP superfamily enzyme
VFNDIWTAYPVGKTFSVVAITTAIILWLIRRVIPDSQAQPSDARLRRWIGLGHMALLAMLVSFVHTGSLSVGNDRVANQLAINGHSQFFEALRTSEIDYHAYYRTLSPADSYRILREQLVRLGGEQIPGRVGRLDRKFTAKPQGLGKVNVVVIMEESLGAEFSAALGGAKDLTPRLDAYGKDGLWFTHMYAQGTRTVRGLEAISSSFPPIPTVSIVRRPNNGNIATWGKVMREAGYSTSFLYGGYGYFDNMNEFFESNGYEVVDRTAIQTARFENIWGVSDEDLFDTALAHFDDKARSGKPFFAQIMTTSNHKPFTFRSGLPGIPEKGGGREAGVRYADYALDYFLKEARKHEWFARTVFVVVADHGARVYGKSQIPIRSYEIPCLIWAPGIVKPAVIDELASQIDLAPTVLGMLGFAYQAPFFGRDILADTPDPPVMLFSHNHDVGLYNGDHLVVLGMQRQVWDYRYDRAADRLIQTAVNPSLEKLAVAYYQTASDLFREHRYE